MSIRDAEVYWYKLSNVQPAGTGCVQMSSSDYGSIPGDKKVPSVP